MHAVSLGGGHNLKLEILDVSPSACHSFSATTSPLLILYHCSALFPGSSSAISEQLCAFQSLMLKPKLLFSSIKWWRCRVLNYKWDSYIPYQSPKFRDHQKKEEDRSLRKELQSEMVSSEHDRTVVIMNSRKQCFPT